MALHGAICTPGQQEEIRSGLRTGGSEEWNREEAEETLTGTMATNKTPRYLMRTRQCGKDKGERMVDRWPRDVQAPWRCTL